MKIEPCPYCKSKDCKAGLLTIMTHSHKIPCSNIRAGCNSCGLLGPEAESLDDAVAKWNWLSKAVGERDYYREKVIQFEIEHKDCNKC